MSNALAIAAVTETLVNLLTSYLPYAGVAAAGVSAVSPDAVGGLANPGINVFLYQVSPNAALRNMDLPTRKADGVTLINKPQAAIDLHYLLTFYGDYAALEPQCLLGAATLAMHSNPTLSRSLINTVLTQPGNTFISTSKLDVQSEMVRFTPIAFTLEELSKLWSFLLKVDYVLSSAYVASVVLIESDDPPPALPLPVLSYSLNVGAPLQPVINQVVASPNPAAPIVAGGDIALVGVNLAAPPGGSTQVLINGVSQPLGAIGPTRITLPLPSGLKAGPQTAQVMQPLSLPAQAMQPPSLGAPATVHAGTGAASGIAAFVLCPVIAPSALPGGYAISVEASVGAPPGPAIAVTVIPKVLAGQRALLQLLPQPGPAASILFDTGVLTADADTLTFPIPTLAAGDYVARVLVDGAQSPVTLGAGGAPVAPLVHV